MLKRQQSLANLLKGEVVARKKVVETQEKLEDGGTLKRKVITTTYVKPVKEIIFIDGTETACHSKDVLVETDIEEHLLQLPCGVIEAYASNCDTDISVTNSEETLPDGSMAKKKIVKMTVHLKEDAVKPEPPKPVPDASSNVERKRIEGEIVSTVKVTESQQVLEDESTIRRKIITTKFVRPVTEITIRDGIEIDTQVKEENIRTEIEEIVLKLPAGVIEPCGNNLETDTTVDHSDDVLPDGTPAKRKLVTMVVRLKSSETPKKVEPVSTSKNQRIEGALTSTTDITER